MLALRVCAVVVPCLLACGCLLDESPAVTGSSTGSATSTDSVRGTFVPRDPGTWVRTRMMDAGHPSSTASSQSSLEDPVHATLDAAAPAAQITRDAGEALTRDAQVTADAARDAQIASDASADAASDAQVTSDASTAATSDARVALDASAPAAPAPPLPVHEYDFSGQGRVVVDRIGGADGELRGRAFLDGNGSVQLGQSPEDGVTLPRGLLTDLSAFTVLGWLDVRSEDCWQRLVDFTWVMQRPGMDGQPRAQGSALYLTPNACPDRLPTAGYLTETSHDQAQSVRPLRRPQRMLLGAMYDAASERLQLIVNDSIAAETPAAIDLDELWRASAALGASYTGDDPALQGSIHEFRIYAQTLDAATLAEIVRRGPDQL